MLSRRTIYYRQSSNTGKGKQLETSLSQCLLSIRRKSLAEDCYQNIMSSSAPQQAVNGSYRMVELLELIALKVGCDSESVSSVMSTYSYQNIMASSAVQQLTNGTYRTVELLELIAKKLGCNSSEMSYL